MFELEPTLGFLLQPAQHRDGYIPPLIFKHFM